MKLKQKPKNQNKSTVFFVNKVIRTEDDVKRIEIDVKRTNVDVKRIDVDV